MHKEPAADCECHTVNQTEISRWGHLSHCQPQGFCVLGVGGWRGGHCMYIAASCRLLLRSNALCKTMHVVFHLSEAYIFTEQAAFANMPKYYLVLLDLALAEIELVLKSNISRLSWPGMDEKVNSMGRWLRDPKPDPP